MALATVALRDDLRPWYAAGLQHLLVDDAVQAWFDSAGDSEALSVNGALSTNGAISASAATSANATASAQNAARSVSHPPAPSARPVPASTPNTLGAAYAARNGAQFSHRAAPQGVPAGYARQQQEQAHAGAEARMAEAKQAAQHASVSSAASPMHVVGADTFPPTAWPQNWQVLWAKQRAPRPIVWTYWGLGEDLGGAPNDARRQFFRALIQQLQLPAGTSAFWPVALPDNGSGNSASVAPAASDAAAPASSAPNAPELIPHAQVFHAALSLLQPRLVVCFGSRALKYIAQQNALRPYQMCYQSGYRLCVLQDIDFLLTNATLSAAVSPWLRQLVVKMQFSK